MVKRWILGGSFLLTILLVFIWFSSKGLLISAIEKRFLGAIQKGTGKEALLGEIHVSLFPPSITIDNLQIPGDPNPGKRGLLEIKKTHIWFSPWSYFTQVFVINRLEVTEPRLFLFEDEAGDSNFKAVGQKLFPSKRSPLKVSMPQFNLKKFIIHRGSVTYQTPEFFAHLPGIHVSLKSGFLLRKLNIQFQANNGTLRFEESPIPIDRMEGRFIVTSNHVSITHLRVDQGNSQVTLKGEVDDFQSPQLDISMKSRIALMDVSQFFNEPLPVSGSLQMEADLRGSKNNISGSSAFSTKSLSYQRDPLGPLSVKFSYYIDEKFLSLKGLDGNLLGGNVSGNFIFPIQKGKKETQISFRAEQINPFPFLDYYLPEYSSLETRVDADLNLKGNGWDFFSYQGKGRLTGQATPNLSSDVFVNKEDQKKIIKKLLYLSEEIDIIFELAEQKLFISSGSFSTPQSRLIFSGTVNPEKEMMLAYQIKPGALGELLPLFGLKKLEGKGSLSGLLIGTPENPRSHGQLKVEDIFYRGKPVGVLTSHLLLQHGTLRVSPTVLAAGKSTYQLKGEIIPSAEETFILKGFADPYFDLSLKIDRGIPRDVVSLFYRELPLMGMANADVEFAGTKKSFELKGFFDVGAGSAYGQGFDRGSVSLSLKRNGITFDRVDVWKNESLLSGKGAIFFDNTFVVHLSTEKVALEEIDLIYDTLPYFEGEVSGVIQGQGSFQHPRMTMTAAFKRIAYQEKDLGEGNLRAVLDGKELQIQSNFFDQSLNLNSRLSLKSPFDYHLSVLVDQARIDPFLALFQPRVFAHLPVTSSGTISGKGNLKHFRKASFQIALSELSFQLGNHYIQNDGEIHLEFQEGSVEVTSLKFKGEETTLSIAGNLKLGQSYDLFVRGETDLSVLPLFTQEIAHAKGKTFLALRIFDHWNDPKIRGGLTSPGGSLRSDTLSQTITLQSMGLLFNENQILLESFEGKMGGGTLVGSGKIDIQNFSVKEFGLLLEMRNVHFKAPEGLSSMVDGTLIFHGTPESRDLKGNLSVERAMFSKKVEWKTWLTDIITGRAQKEKTKVSLVGNTKLNLHLVGRDNIWVDNNLAKFPLSVDLFVRGTFDQPLILGRMEAREGTFFFKRNTFDIKEGSIDFIDPDKTHPIFDIRAETKVRDFEIDLSLTGSLETFDLVVTSQPAMSETDILSLLVTGKTAEEVVESQGGVGTTELVSIATGGVQETLESQAEEITGFDRITVDPYYSGTKAAGGVLITVSEKLLDDDLTVTYSVTPMDLSEQQTVLIEYFLHKNIYLVGSRDELGRMSGNISFRFEYR